MHKLDIRNACSFVPEATVVLHPYSEGSFFVVTTEQKPFDQPTVVLGSSLLITDDKR